MSEYFSLAPTPQAYIVPLNLTEEDKENIPPPYGVQSPSRREERREKKKRSGGGVKSRLLRGSGRLSSIKIFSRDAASVDLPSSENGQKNTEEERVTESLDSPLADFSKEDTPPQSPGFSLQNEDCD